MEIRPVAPPEHEEAGRLIVEAYLALPGGVRSEYAGELAAVERRAREADVLVAIEGEQVVGCVTYVPDFRSPWAELLEPGEAGIRMLAVLPSAQGRGIGRALVDACTDRAKTDGRAALLLHTTPWMHSAHRIYERAGFERVPERDWTPLPEVPLLAYRLELSRSIAVDSRAGAAG